ELDQIKGATQKKLAEGKEDATKSRYLASIVLDVPLEIDLEDCKLTGFDANTLTPILETLELKKFLGKINEIQQQFDVKVVDTPAVEPAAISSVQNSIISTYEDHDLWFFSADDTAAVEKQTASPIQPQIINTEAKLNELVNRLEKFTNPEKPVAWDTETTAL